MEDYGVDEKDLVKIDSALRSNNNAVKMQTINEIYRSYFWMDEAIRRLPETLLRISCYMNGLDYNYILQSQYEYLRVKAIR